jgi:hypothetical protein
MSEDPYEPGLTSAEMGRRYRRQRGDWVHVDQADREVSVAHSRFHGAMVTVHHSSGCAYIGEAAVDLARYLVQGTAYEVREATS